MLKTVFRALVRGELKWPLLLHGKAGTGKSCAALALLDHLCSWQQEYTSADDLTDAVADCWGKCEFPWAKYGRYVEDPDYRADDRHGKRGAALVVLDELGGRDKVTDHHYSAVKRMLDRREGLPLIIVSNHDIEAIGKLYDSRIASRCEAGTLAHLVGPDRRTLV